MYKKIYDVKKLFIIKDIKNYNINHTFEKGLFFKFSDGRISREVKNIDYFLISFQKNDKYSDFSVSGNCEIEKVGELIDKCLTNSNVSKLENIEAKDISLDLKINYDKFSIVKYIKWLKNELDTLMNSIDFNFNFVYTIDVKKSVILSRSKLYESFSSSSQCGVVDNMSFKRSAFISDYFLNSDLSHDVIHKLKDL